MPDQARSKNQPLPARDQDNSLANIHAAREQRGRSLVQARNDQRQSHPPIQPLPEANQ